jgi:hypothetical protein
MALRENGAWVVTIWRRLGKPGPLLAVLDNALDFVRPGLRNLERIPAAGILRQDFNNLNSVLDDTSAVLTGPGNL